MKDIAKTREKRYTGTERYETEAGRTYTDSVI
jgi:hypothetical protein